METRKEAAALLVLECGDKGYLPPIPLPMSSVSEQLTAITETS